ncbi:MAG: RtcB family protein [Candidatus Aenigmatarchaeota archaeon]
MNIPQVKRITDFKWLVEKSGDMNAPAIIYGNQETIRNLTADVESGKEWNALLQLINVACLPGIQKAALAMADVHPGYGFPIGGVGAFDLDKGVISVAGIGFDINCGVHDMIIPLKREDVEKKKSQLAEELFKKIPAGLGSEGQIRLKPSDVDEVLIKGAKYAIATGYGSKADLDFIEENGCVDGADPTAVSDIAKKREGKQLGTLGSGNHYLEVQYVDQIYDEKAASAFGLSKDQILVSIHCGSRALGHQIGTDYLPFLEQASKKYNIPIRDKELVCAPISSPEGKKYFSAVNAGMNLAFANRQVLGHLTRQVLAKVFGIDESEIKTFYDIGHNNAKLEEHKVDGVSKKLLIHRKGATRAFGPNRIEVSEKYRRIGQPVLVGGTMGTASYIMHGTEFGMSETFGSALHGAGRCMSRMAAKRKWWGDTLVKELASKGIIIKAHSRTGVAEEAPGAYKLVDEVVDIMHNSGIVRKVVKLRPLISIKG